MLGGIAAWVCLGRDVDLRMPRGWVAWKPVGKQTFTVSAREQRAEVAVVRRILGSKNKSVKLSCKL